MSVSAPSPRLTRMRETLPLYYDADALTARLMAGDAAELDRLEAKLDAIKQGLVPSRGDERMLAVWEAQFGLPAPVAGTMVEQRRARIRATLRKLSSASAFDTITALSEAAGVATIRVFENSPVNLSDTLEVPVAQGSLTAAALQRMAAQVWPAHRQLFFRYPGGFILDLSRLDIDVL